MPFDPAGEVQFEKHQTDVRRRQAGEADDLVDFDRRLPERLDDARAVVFVGIGTASRRPGLRRIGR